MSEVERNEVPYLAEKESLVNEPIFALTRLRQNRQQEVEMDEDKKISTMAELGAFVQGEGYSQGVHISSDALEREERIRASAERVSQRRGVLADVVAKAIADVQELHRPFITNPTRAVADHISKGGQVIHHKEYVPTTRVTDSLRVRYSIFLDDTKTGRPLLRTQVEHAGLDSILKHQLGLGSPKRRAFFRALANGNNHHIVRGQGKKRNHRLEATRTEL